MYRPRSATVLVASLCLGLWVSPLPAADPAALDRARALLARDDAPGAIAVLEASLPAGPAERPAVLELLRQAYAKAATQADAAGDSRAAELFRDNLEILNRKPGPASASRAPAEAPRAPVDPGVARTTAAAPQPREAVGEPSRDVPVHTASIPSGEAETSRPAPAVAPAAPEVSVATADAAFVARDYAEAGRLYGVLDREKRLPASRRDHWAYCRCAEVVRRLNARPATPQEWEGIDAEIRKIRELSPNNWYAEYLRNLASERTSSRRGRPSQKVVLRGSAPEEPAPNSAPAPAPASPRAAAPRPAPAVAPGPAAPGPAAAVPARPAAATAANLGNWQVRETANFRILHADPALAEQVAEAAEAAREAQLRRWMGTGSRAAWSPRCDIYVYPTGKVFSRMTGQAEDSPGFSTMGMNAGRIIARRVNVRADHPNVLAAVLPHEITHVVLADLFPTQQIPRWADEGIAVLAEPATEQRLRAADLTAPLSTGRLFKLDDLMVMDYPDGKFWALYYAQSVSLTRFLVEQGTPAQFIQFVQGSQRNGVHAELKRVYGIEGFDDLHKRWLAYARTNTSEATVAANPDKDPETARRE